MAEIWKKEGVLFATFTELSTFVLTLLNRLTLVRYPRHPLTRPSRIIVGKLANWNRTSNLQRKKNENWNTSSRYFSNTKPSCNPMVDWNFNY